METVSAIFLIDEFLQNDYIPWTISLNSVLKFSDEVIVIHGGKRKLQNCEMSTYDYISNLNNPKVKLYTFPWKDDFDWTQITRNLTFGQLHVKGDWCFRVLYDEIFPEKMFLNIKKILTNLPEKYKVVSVGRYYLLGSRYVFPYRQKNTFFKTNSEFGYGMVNYKQTEQNLFRIFDEPIDTTKWFDGENAVDLPRPLLIESNDAIERLLNGETPKGYSNPNDHRIFYLDKYFINTDVNFLPDEFIIKQKRTSFRGYKKLPGPYRLNFGGEDLSNEKIINSLRSKIREMATSKRLIKTNIPKDLLEFTTKHNDVHNVVREECERVGLTWSTETSSYQKIMGKIKKLFFREDE